VSGVRAYGHGVFTHGFTYSGHPVACAVALANIDVMEREAICERVRELGPYFIERLSELRRYPIVRDVRGDHLMACIECGREGMAAGEVSEEDIAIAQRVDAFCQSRGLLVRPYENMCILSPPLIVGRAEVDEICRILGEALESVSC
jgi:putrescine aminotransferase